jgi:spore coat protein A
MIALSRRALLGLAGGIGVAALTGCASDGPGTGQLLTSNRALPEPFHTPLPIPPVAKSIRRDDTTDYYVVTQRAADVEILPGVRTTIWGYDGIFPGPTFVGRSGRAMVVTVRNELPVPTSTHLHGGVTPPNSDGFPTDLVVPTGYNVHAGAHAHVGASTTGWQYHDKTKDYVYPMAQRGATLWYHDHRMDFTAPQVWRGLAGAFIVRDDAEDQLGLPGGERDIPLFICDRAFAADGSLRYPSLDPTLTNPGVTEEFMPGVFGDVILVNGAPWPQLEVSNARYRFRLINGSNARRFQLRLSTGGFTQIGSDGGLLAAPVEHTALTIAPGERYDVVVDFSRYRVGEQITLINALGEGRTADVMRFVVTRSEPDSSRVPAVLSTVPKLAGSDAVATRQFDFRWRDNQWTINGRSYDPTAVIATPKLDTVELWRFTSDFHHPVHLHLAQFQVLSRNGRAPLALDGGWKDTVDIRPYEVVEVLARFVGYRGRYMIHCHNLEHEDMAMMANFQVL